MRRPDSVEALTAGTVLALLGAGAGAGAIVAGAGIALVVAWSALDDRRRQRRQRRASDTCLDCGQLLRMAPADAPAAYLPHLCRPRYGARGRA